MFWSSILFIVLHADFVPVPHFYCYISIKYTEYNTAIAIPLVFFYLDSDFFLFSRNVFVYYILVSFILKKSILKCHIYIQGTLSQKPSKPK